MQVEKAREIQRMLDRAAIEHLSWLTRIHCALMFPDPVPAAPPQPPTIPACEPVLGPAQAAHRAMAAQATAMMEAAAADRRVDAGRYRAFMAAVDAYSREARKAETLCRRVVMETDPLTGIHNRQGMMRELRREWTRTMRTGRPCALALADLDHFKRVNDTHGHTVGDFVLCAAARFFQRRLRPYDLVYRYGGEEFLFCLPDTTVATAAQVLDRLRGLMARVPVVLPDGARLAVTVSIGVAEMAAGRSVQETIDAADAALYAAKTAGRDRVVTTQSRAVPRTAEPGSATALGG
ncbi:MAG: diguanylate cyclase [Magnetospirillum sp.]|nr:diguanylate cyclase [Magnetospirillum sp.]